MKKSEAGITYISVKLNNLKVIGRKKIPSPEYKKKDSDMCNTCAEVNFTWKSEGKFHRLDTSRKTHE